MSVNSHVTAEGVWEVANEFWACVCARARFCMRYPVPTHTRSAKGLRLYSVPIVTNIYKKPIESAVDHVCSLLGSLYRGIKEPSSKQIIGAAVRVVLPGVGLM